MKGFAENYITDIEYGGDSNSGSIVNPITWVFTDLNVDLTSVTEWYFKLQVGSMDHPVFSVKTCENTDFYLRTQVFQDFEPYLTMPYPMEFGVITKNDLSSPTSSPTPSPTRKSPVPQPTRNPTTASVSQIKFKVSYIICVVSLYVLVCKLYVCVCVCVLCFSKTNKYEYI